MSAVLEVSGIHKAFDGRDVLTDVGFSLARGETLGIVGESGSGKSTLLRIVLRLMSADSGRVLLDGEDFLALDRRALAAARRRIQLVPQDARHALNPTMSVRGNLAFHLRAQRVPREQWARLLDESLEKVAMPREYLDAYPSQMSGGQNQRVAIARAISAGPKVLVCDEPVSALDKSVQAHVLNTLASLQEDGLSMLFVSHDLAVVEHISDSLMVLDQGQVVDQGATRAVVENPRDDFTRRLLAARHGAQSGSFDPPPPTPIEGEPT